jgi:hypothetical protein
MCIHSLSDVHDGICLYVHGTYMFTNVNICMDNDGHSTDTSTQPEHHNHSSLPSHIRSNQPCKASESQLSSSGSAPSEKPPSCHQTPQLTYHPGVAYHIQTASATGLPHTHCCHNCHPLLQCHSCPLGSQTACAGCICDEW